MSKFLGYVSRFGPLVAALAVGLGGLIEVAAPGAKPFVDAVVSFLSVFGAAPDAAIASEVTAVVASGFLVYGGVRKLISLIRAL